VITISEESSGNPRVALIISNLAISILDVGAIKSISVEIAEKVNTRINEIASLSSKI